MKKPTGPKYPRPLSLRLDDDLQDALEEAAKREDRPVGMMARLLLREALQARRVKSKKKTS